MKGPFYYEDGAQHAAVEHSRIMSSVGDTGTDGNLDSVFSSGFSSSPRSEMYQAWVYPELHPKERQPVLDNWADEDLWAFCGITERPGWCDHPDVFFDRTLCACDSMHYYCESCGDLVDDDCPYFYEAD